MSSNGMSAAQAAQQSNRDAGGRYAEKQGQDPGDLGLPVVLDEDEFYDQFEPLTGPEGSDIWSFDDVQAAGIPIERVWSVADGDSGGSVAAPGYHVVNVYGYMVTEKPWTDEGTVVVLDEGDGDVD